MVGLTTDLALISIAVVGPAASCHLGHLILSIWDSYLGVGTRLCVSDRRRDPIDVQLDDRPSRIAEDYDRDDPVGEILLVADVLVGCQKNLEGCFLRGSQEFAVAQCIPTKVFRLFDYVVLEE
jgi:hypothetical protein